MNTNESYSVLIKIARKKSNLTQKNVSQRLGISQGAYAQYEQGTRIPKPETLQRIADAIGCDVMEIMPPNLLSDFSTEKADRYYRDHETSILIERVKGLINEFDKIIDLGGRESIYNALVDVLRYLEKNNRTIGLTSLNDRDMTYDCISYLNDEGRQKLLEYAEDLCRIDKYRL